MTRVLVVEDNPDLAFGLRNSFEISGYDVLSAPDGRSGLEAARSAGPDLVVLDLMLPDLDGYRVLRELRQDGSELPVLILTARTEEADKVMGFRLGADDYVTKPFGVLELMARVEALLRRAQRSSRESCTSRECFGRLTVDRDARRVWCDSDEIVLSPKEYDLLLALLRRPNRVVSRGELLKLVWGYQESVMSRTVDTHIAELRRKIEPDPATPRHIITVWKVGYRFVPDPLTEC